VQVHYGEGVANHADLESCAAYREVCGEALTGERAGQPLSHEIFLIQDADVVTYTEGKTNGCEHPRTARWSGAQGRNIHLLRLLRLLPEDQCRCAI
jgi:hypothetical protein